MALVNIDSALKQAVSRLDKMSPQEGLDILSYKRNRSIYVMKMDKESVLICERGYKEQRFIVKLDELQKTLRPMFKTEFPRSRKVRMYYVPSPEMRTEERKKL